MMQCLQYHGWDGTAPVTYQGSVYFGAPVGGLMLTSTGTCMATHSPLCGSCTNGGQFTGTIWLAATNGPTGIPLSVAPACYTQQVVP